MTIQQFSNSANSGHLLNCWKDINIVWNVTRSFLTLTSPTTLHIDIFREFWFRSAVQLQKHDVRKRGNFETYLYKLASKIVSNPIRSQTDFQNFAWKTWKIVGDDTQNSPHDYEYICFISRFLVLFKQNCRNLQGARARYLELTWKSLFMKSKTCIIGSKFFFYFHDSLQ